MQKRLQDRGKQPNWSRVFADIVIPVNLSILLIITELAPDLRGCDLLFDLVGQ